jgi:uncharacterized protein
MTDPDTRKVFVFYGIALALAVLVRLAVPWIGEASLFATMLTPAIAAAAMLFLVAPEGGLRAAILGLGLDRAELRGWPLAIGGPAAIHAVGLTILAAAGLTALMAPEMPGSGTWAVFKILTGLVIGTLLALCEEAGWRGYMLPRMKSFALVPAMLIVGFLHGVWHLPIMLTTGYYHSAGNPFVVAPLFLITLTLAGIFYGFLRVWTGSVWPVAVAHAAANMAWEIGSEVSQAKSVLVIEYIGGESGLVMIAGLLIIDAVLIWLLRRPL